MFLTDTAQRWFQWDAQQRIIANKLTWPDFKAELEAAFLPSNYETHLREQLRNYYQKPDEPVGNYVYEKRHLCSRINPNMSEQEMITYLFEGLRPEIKTSLYNFEPTTIKSFLEHAKRIERGLQNNKRSDPHISELLEKITQLQQFLQISPRQREKRRVINNVRAQNESNSNHVKCYRCQEFGHYSRDCMNQPVEMINRPVPERRVENNQTITRRNQSNIPMNPRFTNEMNQQNSRYFDPRINQRRPLPTPRRRFSPAVEVLNQPHNVGSLSEEESIGETLIIVKGFVNEKAVMCLIDTGSSVSIISPMFLPEGVTISPYAGSEIRAVSGEKLVVLGQIRAQVKIQAIPRPIWVKLLIAEPNGFDCLLGNNFNKPAGLTVDCQNLRVYTVENQMRSSTLNDKGREQIEPHYSNHYISSNHHGLLPEEDSGYVFLGFEESETNKLSRSATTSMVAHLRICRSNELDEKEGKQNQKEEREIIETIENLTFPDIESSQSHDLTNLLLDFSSQFALSSKKLGHCSLAHHVIDTGNSSPISRAPYRYSVADQENIRQQI